MDANRPLRALTAGFAAIALLAGCANQLSHDELLQAAGRAPVGTVAQQEPAAAEPSAGAVPESGSVPSSAGAVGAVLHAPDQSTSVAGTSSGKRAQLTPGPSASKVTVPVAGGAAGGLVPVACTGPKAPVVIGAVGQLSGPLGIGFIGGTRAIQAWIAMVNAQGGPGCHLIKYITADDGGDPSRHLSLVRQLVEQDHVIAMLYQTALLTGQASRDYVVSKKIPVIGQEGGELQFFDAPTFFSHASAGRPLIDLTMYAGARAAKADGVSKMGILTCTEVTYCGVADADWDAIAKKQGLDLVYRGKASLLNVDFTSQCLSAKNAGTEALVVAFESTAIHRIARSCASVGFKPIIVLTSVQSNADFAEDPALDRAVVAQPILPWFLTDRPAIRQYQSVLNKWAPGLPFDSASLNGWGAAQLFSRAASAFAADVVTSEGITKALSTVKNDDLAGLTYPLSFSPDKPQEPKICGWVVRMLKGQFVSDGKMFCAANLSG
jgi:branched-chain amino acid transport system substrate-binding protein